MPKTLRAVQIGIGGMGRGHFQRIVDNPRFEVVAACDAYPNRPDVKQSVALAKERKIPFYRDYEKMLGAVEADAAFVATPHHWHRPMTVACLERGMGVFVEKPPTCDIADADAMLAAARKAKLPVSVGFNPTANGATIALKNHVARGDLGQVRGVVVVLNDWRADEYYRRNHWAGRRRVEGKWARDGVMYNQASHSIAAGLYLATNKPFPALAVGTSARSGLYRAHKVRTFEMEDLACAVVALDGDPNKQMCLYVTTANQADGGVSWVQVFGEEGSAVLGAGVIRRHDGRIVRIKPRKNTPSKYDNLYQAITRGATPFCPLEQAVKVTYTIQQVYKASREQVKPISFKELGNLNDLIPRAAAQRCLFSELRGMPEWAY